MGRKRKSKSKEDKGLILKKEISSLKREVTRLRRRLQEYEEVVLNIDDDDIEEYQAAPQKNSDMICCGQEVSRLEIPVGDTGKTINLLICKICKTRTKT